MSLFNLAGKTAVITGGGSGIGRSISKLFAQQGATVFILELNSEAATQTLQDITEQGGQADSFACNVSNQEEVFAVFDNIKQQTGRIDIVINNAGIAHVGNIEQTS